MNKKGFTLIELLAVIVILAVIALIATPVVMNSINNARRGAAENAGYGVVKAIEHQMATNMLTDENYTMPTSFATANIASLNMQGTKPTAATLTISNGSVSSGQMTINGYILRLCEGGKIVSRADGTLPPVGDC